MTEGPNDGQHLANQLRFREIERRLDVGESRMNAMQLSMDENTRITAAARLEVSAVKSDTGGLVAAWNNVQGGFKVLEVIGRLQKPLLVLTVIGAAIAIGWARLKSWAGM